MSNGQNTLKFLSAITPQAKTQIIQSIANHYGVSESDIFDEVIDDEAEHLLDYMVEPERSATSVLMQKHGVR